MSATGGPCCAQGAVRGVISDFGGVLTTPLLGSFKAFTQRSGVSLEELGRALAEVGRRMGANPLFELETGRLSERDFLDALSEQLGTQLSRPVDMSGFGEHYFAELDPNRELIDYLRSLRERGYRLAICTNNVREWERLWRAMLPVDEIFDVVVDSSAVGTRKPERRIFELTLEALGLEAAEAVLLDDLEENCAAARELGLHAIRFHDTRQAISDLESVLDGAA